MLSIGVTSWLWIKPHLRGGTPVVAESLPGAAGG
jgi:hypothetical protein